MVKRIGNGLWIYEQGEDFLVVKGYCPNEVYDKSEADSYIRLLDNHHKYKRCLAMARWCAAERDIYNLTPKFAKMNFYKKWCKRWLELAEKFKETK